MREGEGGTMRARYWWIIAAAVFVTLAILHQTTYLLPWDSKYDPSKPTTYTFTESECSSEVITDPNAGPGIKRTCTHIDWRRDSEARPGDQGHVHVEGP
jgi:hypothetical protein